MGTLTRENRTISGMPHPAIEVHWNGFAAALAVAMAAALAFYFYVRIAHTIPHNYAAYSWTIMFFELLGGCGFG